MTLNELAGRLNNVRPKPGGGFTSRCPAHDDRENSLSVDQAADGKLLLHCFAGCSAAGVCRALGITTADLSGENGRRPAGPPKARRVVATYPYTDATGKLLFEVLRYDPKSFCQRRPAAPNETVTTAGGRELNARQDPRTGRGWMWSLEGGEPVLYHLPDVLRAAQSGGTVWVVEGEKDADALARLGLTATTAPMGAGKWRRSYSEALRGADVVVLPDNDQAGQAHADAVARSLRGIARRVRLLALPGIPQKGDVSDWLAAGGTREALEALAADTPDWTPPDAAAPAPLAVVRRLADVQPEAVMWLWPGWLPRGKLALLDGDPGLGKSLITLDLAARVTTGAPMPDGTGGGEPAGVVILTAEDDLSDTVRPRLDAAGADVSKIAALTAVRRTTDGGGEVLDTPTLLDLEALRQAIAFVSAALVIIDPLMAYLPGQVDSHRDQDVRRVLAPLAALAAETNAAVLVVRHLSKTTVGNPLYRGGGSIGIMGAARAGLIVGKDPEDPTGEQRVLAVTKCNLAAPPPGLAYRLAADGPVRVEWLGQTALTAAALLAAPPGGEERTALADAEAFLRAFLADGPVEAKTIQARAREAGIAEPTLRRAKARVGVEAFLTGFGAAGRWHWRLPLRRDDHEIPEMITLKV